MGYLQLLDLVLEEGLGVLEGRRFRNALKLSGLQARALVTLDDGRDLVGCRRLRDPVAGAVKRKPPAVSGRAAICASVILTPLG
jgi:hypothetical protein